MKNHENRKGEYFAISFLREALRAGAKEQALRLSRSVGRLTSCDWEPCLEYGEEVQAEHVLAQRLFYLQHCRDALERCIDTGGAVLRYHWQDGTVTVTRLRKVGPNRVKVWNLLPGMLGESH